MPETQSLNISHIRRDGGTQPRATLDADTIRNYAEAYSRGEELPPVDVFYDGSNYWLADGFHRTQGAEDAGHDEIDADVRQGTQRDAILYSVQANAIHGLPRNAEDKRRAVMRLLEDDEWSLWSDRKIAEATRTSHPFVGKLRKEVFGDDISAERVVERDGQTYTMSTGGINEDREPTMLEIAHDYMRRILDMLPDEGLLYLTIRNQLDVRQSNKTQMDALKHALDMLFGQQKLAKRHGRYVLAARRNLPYERIFHTPSGIYINLIEVIPGGRWNAFLHVPDGPSFNTGSSTHSRQHAIRTVNVQYKAWAAAQSLPDSDNECDLSDILDYPVSQLESFLADKSSTELQQLLDLESAGKNRATALRTLRTYQDTAQTMDAILDQLDGSASQSFTELREHVYATGHSINFQTSLKLLVEREQVEKVGNRYQLPAQKSSLTFAEIKALILKRLDGGEMDREELFDSITLDPDERNVCARALVALVTRKDVVMYKSQRPGADEVTLFILASQAVDGEPIDHIDPVTAEVTRIPATAGEQPPPDSDEAIDATTRAWLREQLANGKRHYNILTRVSRADKIPMRSLLRVLRAMIDNGEVEEDGLMYGLAGDQHVQVLPDDLAEEDKIAIRDALVAAVRDEALAAPQINNAIHAATGKKLDIHYLITWLEKWAHDGKLVTFTSNHDVPRYQLNPNPPTDDDLQQRRAATDLEERLDIVRRAIADRLPSEAITVTWLKRAAPAACTTAAEAGNLLTKLVELDELRVADDQSSFEPVDAAAESTDPGQDGEAAIEPAGEPCERVANAPIDEASRPLGMQGDEHTAQVNTAIEFSTKFELALFRLDDAFKLVRAIKSIQTWHTLEPRQLESVREAITMARAWLFDLDGFLEDFDGALAQILETGEPYLDLIAAKPVDDEQVEAVQA